MALIEDLEASFSNDLLRLQPESLKRGLIGTDDPVILISDRNEIGHGIEGRLPFRFGPGDR